LVLPDKLFCPCREFILPRAPHPAAAGGGFGFGKFRRDEQRCLVKKRVVEPNSLTEAALAQVKRPNYPGVHDFLPVR
jgi:hypothetical protein